MLPEYLKCLFKKVKGQTENGNLFSFGDGISCEEAEVLYNVVFEHSSQTTLEVGLAGGASAVSILEGKKQNQNKNCIHYAIDPNQLTEYKSQAIKLVEEFGFSTQFITS